MVLFARAFPYLNSGVLECLGALFMASVEEYIMDKVYARL